MYIRVLSHTTSAHAHTVCTMGWVSGVLAAVGVVGVVGLVVHERR